MTTATVFPTGFRFGVATAAQQIEGACHEDGRADSVWDVYARRPGAIKTGEHSEIACDHYHRFADDVRIMADLGVRHYRFSISWPRVLPQGRGAVNEKGFDFYQRLLDQLQRHGIEPHVTLYHWDTPQALEDEYGSWLDRRIVDDFAAYAGLVAKRLGDRVRSWMTLNEIGNFTWNSYPVGTWKPGPFAPGRAVSRLREVLTTVHHALLAHGHGAAAVRAASPGPCRIAVADNPLSQVPISESPADVAAAAAAYTAWNGSITTPLLTGKYGESFVRDMEAKGEWLTPEIFRPGDLDCLTGALDAYGLNVYTGAYVKAVQQAPGWRQVDLPPDYWRYQGDGFAFMPESLYWAARHAREVLGWQGPMFVSENGCSSIDRRSADGAIDDVGRIQVLRSYLNQVTRMLAEGFPVDGYFQWSFLDNYEWTSGYSMRFGLVGVDFQTQARTPKASARWYAECIRQRRVV